MVVFLFVFQLEHDTANVRQFFFPVSELRYEMVFILRL